MILLGPSLGRSKKSYAENVGTLCSCAEGAGKLFGISPNSQALICNAMIFE